MVTFLRLDMKVTNVRTLVHSSVSGTLFRPVFELTRRREDKEGGRRKSLVVLQLPQ